MDIICPRCGKIHRLPADRLPARRSAAKCKKCGAGMIIDPRAANEKTGGPELAPGEIGRAARDPREFDILLTDRLDGPREKNTLLPPPVETVPTDNPDNADDGIAAADAEIFAAYPELHKLSPEKFVYREILTRTEQKGYQTGDNRLKLKIAKAVHELLRAKILREDEQVMRLARGIAYYPFEIPYANGLLTMLSNYYAIVCTNRRLLLVNIDCRTSHPTRYIHQIPYREIARVGRGLFLSSLVIECKTGRKWNFTTVRRHLGRSVRNFILQKSRAVADAPPNNVARWQLCPACHTPLPAKLHSCPHCAATFKKPAEAMLRSLILPGLGSLYLDHLPLGGMELTGYLAAWSAAVVMMIMEIPGGLAAALAPVLLYHAAIGLIALKTAGKGYLRDNPTHARPGAAAEKGGEINIGASLPT